MLKLSDLQYLMHQLGPAMPEITTIVQQAIDSWMVEFDEGVSLQLAWEQRAMQVLLKCALGQPDEGAREEIYAALLSANLLLTGVADVKLGLSHVDDDVVLIGEYARGRIDRHAEPPPVRLPDLRRQVFGNDRATLFAGIVG